MKKGRIIIAVTALCLCLLLCGCSDKPQEPEVQTPAVSVQTPEPTPEEPVESVSPTEPPEEIIEEPAQIIIADEAFEISESEISVPASVSGAEELKKALPQFAALERVDLRGAALGAEEISELMESFPALSFSYSIEIDGITLDETTESLELDSNQAELFYSAKGLLKNVNSIAITDSPAVGPDLELLAAFGQACPWIDFDYSFTLFGRTVSTHDKRIEYVGVPIGEEGVDELRLALPCLAGCEYFLLDNCRIGNETLDALSREFPERNIVWRINFGYFNFLTDVKVIHLTDLVEDENVYQIGYCRNLEYLDIGHNSITDISFISRLENLKLCILSFNKVYDLEPFRNLEKLEMLELYYCLNLNDISAVESLPNLRLFNITWTAVSDISVVANMKQLTRFSCYHNFAIPDEQKQAVLDALPDCWVTFEDPDFDRKWVGWRFDDVGVKSQWYDDISKIFYYQAEPVYFGEVREGYEDRHFS